MAITHDHVDLGQVKEYAEALKIYVKSKSGV